jgi:hypothetical protein
MLQEQSALQKLGMDLPHAKLKVSDTLNNPNFNIQDYYSVEEIDDFYPILNSLLDLWDVHGPEHVKEALGELGDAGSSAAWRVLATLYEQRTDFEGLKNAAWLGVRCALNNWDVLLSMNILARAIALKISASKDDTDWLYQNPHPLSADISEVSAALHGVVQRLYPDSDELRFYLSDDLLNTRQMLTESGTILHDIHMVFGRKGHPPGHIGLMALGMTLMIDFGNPQQKAAAEASLKNLVTIQGQFSEFADQILEIDLIKPKLKQLGVWRWG